MLRRYWLLFLFLANVVRAFLFNRVYFSSHTDYDDPAKAFKSARERFARPSGGNAALVNLNFQRRYQKFPNGKLRLIYTPRRSKSIFIMLTVLRGYGTA